MKTLLIQVLGVGLIPRGKGIAPKKEPFPATKQEIELILEHGTLTPRMFNTKTGGFVQITARNFDKLWNTFAVERDAHKRTVNRPKATPATIPVVKNEEPKVVNKPAPQPQVVKNNNQNPNNQKPKWEQKQEQRQQQEQKNDTKPADEPKKEEEKKNDEAFSVVTSSDKK